MVMVSVIIPIYNTHPELLDQTIYSVLGQSLQTFEIILVNDGTSDQQSLSNIEHWKTRDPRIRILTHSSNRGLAAARNTGIRHSSGNYIFFLDSDGDQIEPTTLEKLVWKLYTSPHIHFTKGHTIGYGAINYTWTKGFEIGDGFLGENQVTASIMFKRDVFIIGNTGSNSGLPPYQTTKKSQFFGYDEAIVGGMEDWDFLIKCADRGIWGETVPEYMDWYKRKDQETSKKQWSNFSEQNKDKFKSQLKTKYPRAYVPNLFPKPTRIEQQYHVEANYTIINPLSKTVPRVLLVLPWLNTGGADKFNLNLVRQLLRKGWEITIVTTIDDTTASDQNQWLNQFQILTNDIFIVNHFITSQDLPRFLCYLVQSRRIDTTFISNSELGYLLIPYLREQCPQTAVVDYNHMEEEHWKNGGFPRYSLSMQSLIDQSIVASDHLKEWMNHRSSEHSVIYVDHQDHHDDQEISPTVSYINVDTKEFSFNFPARARVRTRYGIPSNHMVILYAARLTDQKRPLLALEVIKKLVEKRQNGTINSPFSVLFVGDGPLREQVDEYVHRHGLNGGVVKILGSVPPDDMPSIISASDIVFLPSSMEGISLLFYEAMSIGVVPVGSNVGGQSELVTAKEGILVDVEQETIESQTNKFIAALESLLNNQMQTKAMSNRCKERINDHFHIDQMGESIITEFCKANFKKTNRVEHLQKLVKRRMKYNNNRLGTGIGVEMAIQSIELMKWQKKSDDMWKSLEAYRKNVERDKIFHQTCEQEKQEIFTMKQKILKLETEHSRVTQEYEKYVQENENLFNKYEDLMEDLEFCRNLQLSNKKN
eukprot:gene9722-11938_t